MANEIDLGKVSITPVEQPWTDTATVEINDIWTYQDATYLALQNSVGVTPTDDKVYWSMLSKTGKSAYEAAVSEGFIGTEQEWLASLKQPAVEAAARADSAITAMQLQYPDALQDIHDDLYAQLSDDLRDQVVKPLTISTKEQLAGSYNIGGETLDIYERSIQMIALPTTEGETKEFVIADEPLGLGLYLNIESFIASSGKGLTKEFFNFNYDIVRMYVNESLQSCIVVKCKNTVADEINGLLHITYCKFWGDIVEFDVALPDGVDKDAISLEIPALKYNKKMAFSYITDDSYSIYQYIFSLINKRYIAKTFELPDGRVLSWHLGMQGNPSYEQYVSDAYYPTSPAQCTDGAGIKKRYATTVSTWPDKLKDQYIGKDVGMQYPWISEKEFKLFFDFGFMLAYHDLVGYDTSTTTQEKFNKCVDDTAALFKEYVKIVPKIMVEPNGDHAYIDFSQGNDIIQAITAQSGDTRIQKVYPFSSNFSLDKTDVIIQRLFAYGSDLTDTNDNPQYATDLLNILSEFNTTEDKNSIYWLIGSAHRSSHWESVLIKNIHDLYGDTGLDNLWFPTVDEFFEYWYMRQNTLSVKTITDTGVHYKLYVPKAANFFFRDLSVMLDGISSLTGVNVTSGDNVYGTSFAINDNKLLVNLNFNELLMQRVNKYVEAFEADYNKEYAYDDAYYFVQMLKVGLREEYEARLNRFTSPPVLLTCIVNNGDASTESKVVSVTTTYSGQEPSHIMISEDPTFSGAEWQTYAATVQFTLSDGFESKTIYCKLKNVYGDSAVLSSSIELLEPDVVLTGFKAKDGITSTSERNVQFEFAYTGYPTEYMLAEVGDVPAAEWLPFVENPMLTLSEGFGEKTIYGRLRSSKNTSEPMTISIELIDNTTVRLDNIVINNNADYTSNGVVSVAMAITNTATKYKIGKEPDLSDCPDWLTFSSSPVSYDTSVTNGQVTVYAQVANETSESAIVSDTITVVQPITLSSMSLADGSASIDNLTVPVTFDITVGTPTHYRLSESEASLEMADWIAWSDTITYSFASIGDKTLYGQVKNEVSESVVVNDAITLTEPPVMALLGFNASTNNSVEYHSINGVTINQVRIADYDSYTAQQLKNSQGEMLPWYMNNNTSKYTANAIFADNGTNNYESQSTANDSGIFPVAEFRLCYSTFNNTPEGTRKLRVSLTLPAGTYKARLLYSPGDKFLLTEQYRVNSYYGVFAGETQLAKVNVSSDGFTGQANNDYNNTLQFTVATTGDIDFAAWQEGSPTQQFRPGFNFIELTKLA